MKESASNNPYREYIRQRLCTLFLYTVFVNPLFMRREIAKHLELPIDSINLTLNEQTEEHSVYLLRIEFADNLQEFSLTFNRKDEQPKEIEVPSITKRKRKWWQFSGDEELTVEKKIVSTESTTYWILHNVF